ncbi:eukaryotic translation initiation factor 4 gamma 1 isoform X1 [Drosophila busckii]|uniref:eukaryotic translation initiation factor 4 gamma 1 isoform X1 n=1 Tax=Drosophila busckii TaxID=30019 RepID=UPI00083F16D1|nr:eukaryotic translation initiation factor 4 gamma 1 isoform X1 [Drosophila busckii]
MQPTVSTLSTQAEIAKIMQPHSSQNMILPANKNKKKYASQVQVQVPGVTKQSQPLPQLHSTSQPFQINKAYNVVSILKTSTASNVQQSAHIPQTQAQVQVQAHQAQPQSHHQQSQSQHLQQSYANVVNRPITGSGSQVPVQVQVPQSTVICSSGNIMTVNSCQLNGSELSSAAGLYNLTGHRAQMAVDPNARYIGNASTASDISNASVVGSGNILPSPNVHSTHTQLSGGPISGGGGGISSCNSGGGSGNASGAGCHNGSNNIVTLGNTHGISISPSAGSYVHEKSLLGMSVGVNVGVNCIDGRKYDYKNNNLLSSSNYQAVTAKEYVTSGNNSSGNNRANPQSTGLFRGPPPTSNAPRSSSGAAAARHVPMPAMFPGMVVPQYPAFNPRHPTFSPHIQYTHAHIPYYPYQYMPTLTQQPPHSRSGVAVNASVNIGNTMPVQSGPNGPLAAPGATTAQMQLLTGAVQPGASTVLGVGATGNNQVGVPPMVSVLPQSVTPQPVQVPPAGRRRHQHRLQIIDPATKKNILDDFDKSNSNVENEYQEITAVTSTAGTVISQAEVPICISHPDADGPGILHTSSDSRASAHFKIDPISVQRSDVSLVQTPVVSAMSDAPSVEILPTPTLPKVQKSKKILIVSPKDEVVSPTVDTVRNLDNVESNSSTNIKTSNECIPEIQDCTPTHPQPEDKLPQQHPQSHSQFMAHAFNSLDTDKSCARNDNAISEVPLVEVQAEGQTLRQASVSKSEATVTTSDSNAAGLVDSIAPLVNTVQMHITEPPTTAFAPTSSEKVKKAATLDASARESSHESTPDETDRVPESSVLMQTPVQLQLEIENALTSLSLEKHGEEVARGKGSAESIDIDVLRENASAGTKETGFALEAEPKSKSKTKSEVQDQPQDQSVVISPDAEMVTASDNTASQVSGNSTVTSIEQQLTVLICYNEGQWSPKNPSGKKQYDREQLMQLREAKASRVQPDVKNVSILPHPNLMPLFMRNNSSNKRVQSMVGMIGGNTGAGNRSNDLGSGGFMGKQTSMSGVQGGRSSMKGMIHVNLSLNQDVKLNETENAWRPRTQAKLETEGNPDNKTIHEKDELVKRVRGILNKLTPERFDTLVEEIIKLKIDTTDKMNEVIVLVFEKAIDEPNFSVSYARLCHRLITEVKARDERMESGTKSNLAHFRNALLDKTEREFTQNVSQSTAKEKKLQPLVDKIKKCTDPNEKADLESLLEEEERKIRRRSGGTVRFIGELFKISMLTGKIIYSCIDTLLNPHSEDMLECLCKLLTTVGAKFEQTPVNAKDPGRCYSLEKSITRMQAIASKTDKDGVKVSSRVRFMLQDVIDLRKNKWQSTRNEAPKTMGQIEKEAKNEQLSAQYLTYSGSLSTSNSNGPQSGGSGKRDDRSRYGDSRSTGYGSHSQRGVGGESGGTGGGGGSSSSSIRHQQQNSSGNGSVGGVGGSSSHSNGNNDDNTWHVQTSKGSRSQAVDSNKLEGLTLQLNQNLDTKKMGGVSQFIWSHNANRQSSTPTTTPSNSFAALSLLIDKSSSTDKDRDRDRSGPRNKGSYNKNSMERERYNDRGIHSRTGSSQGSRENSSSRVSQHQQGRGPMNSSLQKSASHSKYTQQAPPARLSNKTMGSLSSTSSNSVGGLFRASDQSSAGASASQSSASSSNSGMRKTAAPAAFFIAPRDSDQKLFNSVISEIIELAVAKKMVDQSMSITCIKRIPEQQRCGFLFYMLTDYLHLSHVDKQYRRYLAITIAQLIQQNYMSVDHFKLAYKEFSEYASDLIVDIPELWLYIMQFAGPLIVKEILTISDLWNQNLSCSNMGKKFLKTYLTYCAREIGPNFTRSMWKRFNMRWSDFMSDNEVNDFIESNRLEYVENEMKMPVFDERQSAERLVQNVIDHIEHLLKEGATADCIIDYSNGNIVVADKLFIKGLTETLCNFAIVYKENSYKLELETFQKLCIPIFQRYIDSNEDLQLECLYGLQLLVHSLEHPRGLLSELFGELYDGYVIQKESLCKWRDSKDQSAGKGVAVKSLNPFFNSIFNDEAN